MAADSQQKGTYETKGIPSVYCNHAGVTLSYNDIRVYLSEASPSEIAINPTGSDVLQQQPLLEPRFSLVLSPEFARSLSKALTTAVDQYEAVFGHLRPEPTQEQIKKAIEKK